MTNTYTDDEPHDVKLLEEMRCLRSVLERILRVMDEGLFVDYQMEKFTGKKNVQPPNPPQISSQYYPPPIYGLSITTNPCSLCYWPKELQEKYHGTYVGVGDSPCQSCPHGLRVTC